MNDPEPAGVRRTLPRRRTAGNVSVLYDFQSIFDRGTESNEFHCACIDCFVDRRRRNERLESGADGAVYGGLYG